jgi:hypothetical protein
MTSSKSIVTSTRPLSRLRAAAIKVAPSARTAYERAQIPEDGELWRTHHLDQRRRLLRHPERPKELMRALKGRGVRWQAGVTSKLAQDDRMLELAAESGCAMLSIGFESISRETLKSVHKHVNRPENFMALVEKVH